MPISLFDQIWGKRVLTNWYWFGRGLFIHLGPLHLVTPKILISRIFIDLVAFYWYAAFLLISIDFKMGAQGHGRLKSMDFAFVHPEINKNAVGRWKGLRLPRWHFKSKLLARCRNFGKKNQIFTKKRRINHWLFDHFLFTGWDQCLLHITSGPKAARYLQQGKFDKI